VKFFLFGLAFGEGERRRETNAVEAAAEGIHPHQLGNASGIFLCI
jgi:hypothetical protein